MNIILIGHKGAGKTTIGQLLAKKLDYQFVDTDAMLLTQNPGASSIATVYKTLGDTIFRDQEAKIVQGLNLDHTVLSVGGGAILNPDSVKHLQGLGRVVYLHVPFEYLLDRNMSRDQSGIIEATVDPVVDYEERDQAYNACTDMRIDCKNGEPETVVKVILSELEKQQKLM